MIQLECLEMNKGKLEGIHLAVSAAHKALVDSEALKDFMINLGKEVEVGEHLLETYLKSLTNFLEEASKKEDREVAKVVK